MLFIVNISINFDTILLLLTEKSCNMNTDKKYSLKTLIHTLSKASDSQISNIIEFC
jgi:hypothetical protein